LLATGTALGVYLSILRSPEPWDLFQRVVLVHGVRQATDLTYGETLAAIAERRGERFKFVPAVIVASLFTDLLTGGGLESHVGAAIDHHSSHVMLCGNSDMIKDAKVILEERGLARHKRHAPGQYTTEQYH